MLYKLSIAIKRDMNHIYKNGTLYKSEIIRYMHLNRTLNAKLDYINICIVQFHYFLAKIARKVTIYLVEWLPGGMGQGRVRENHT